MSKAKICDMCGGSGYSASILTCCLCKINSEHIYCRLAMTANVPEFWYCDECLANADLNRKMQALDGGKGRIIKKSTEGLPGFPIFRSTLKRPWTQNNKSSRLGKKSCKKVDNGFRTHEYRFQSSLCHPNNYPNGREILLTGKSYWKPMAKREPLHACWRHPKTFWNNTSRREIWKTTRKNDLVRFSPFRAWNHSHAYLFSRFLTMGDCVTYTIRVLFEDRRRTSLFYVLYFDSCLYLSRRSSSDWILSIHHSKAPPLGNLAMSGVYKSCRTALEKLLITVTFHVADGKFCALCEVDVHFPVNLSHKAWEYSKRMPEVLKLEVMPRSDVWPKIFKQDPPTIDDVGLLFFPTGVERSLESYGHLLNYLESRDAALRYCIVGGELLIYPSKQLSGGGDLKYFWGAFRVVRRKESLQKALLNIMDHAIPPFPTGYPPSRHGGPEPAKEKFTRNQDHEVYKSVTVIPVEGEAKMEPGSQVEMSRVLDRQPANEKCIIAVKVKEQRLLNN